MNGSDCLADTNILILLQNGDEQIANYIDGKTAI